MQWKPWRFGWPTQNTYQIAVERESSIRSGILIITIFMIVVYDLRLLADDLASNPHSSFFGAVSAPTVSDQWPVRRFLS
jgi:hypothetical protein